MELEKLSQRDKKKQTWKSLRDVEVRKRWSDVSHWNSRRRDWRKCGQNTVRPGWEYFRNDGRHKNSLFQGA